MSNHRLSGRDVVRALQRCVDKFPDLRVGQLICVASKAPAYDPFNTENGDLAEKLADMYRTGKS